MIYKIFYSRDCILDCEDLMGKIRNRTPQTSQSADGGLFPETILSDSTRAYYLEVWGFDPLEERYPGVPSGRNSITDRQSEHGREGSSHYYECEFRLTQDPVLNAAGVTIHARVIVLPTREVEPRIVFKREDREAEVTCVHTAIYSGPISDVMMLDEDDLLEASLSTEFHPVTMDPLEHYVSLKSYVGGIAGLGLENMLNAVYLVPEDQFSAHLPFGFNDLMQEQVLQALVSLAPRETEFLLQGFVPDLSVKVKFGLLSPELSWTALELMTIEEDSFFRHELALVIQEKAREESRRQDRSIHALLYNLPTSFHELLGELPRFRFLQRMIREGVEPTARNCIRVRVREFFRHQWKFVVALIVLDLIPILLVILWL